MSVDWAGGDGSSAGSVHALGELRYWEAGRPLGPLPGGAEHLGRPIKRLARRVAYGSCVRLLDRFQPDFPEAYQPPVLD